MKENKRGKKEERRMKEEKKKMGIKMKRKQRKIIANRETREDGGN